MKVTIPAGRVIQLDARRTTSIRGGTYDISQLPEAERKRILGTEGVAEVKPAPPAKTKEA